MSEGTHITQEFRQRVVDAVLYGMTKPSVAVAYGVDRKTITRWVSGFQEGGGTALFRQSGSGRPRTLERVSKDELLGIVIGGARKFGFKTDLWSVGRLRRVLADEFQITVSKNRIWRRLRDAGLTNQKPERECYEIDEATRKKWLRFEVPKIPGRLIVSLWRVVLVLAAL